MSTLASGQASLAPFGSQSWILLPVFGAAVVAIMLSTVSALLSAVTFTAYQDLPPFSQQQRSLTRARLYTLAIAAAGSVLYFALRHVIGVAVRDILYTFYSSQLALFPVVIASLYTKRASGAAGILSIAITIPVTFAAAIHLPDFDPNYGLLPPLVAVVVSSAVYGLAISIRRPD